MTELAASAYPAEIYDRLVDLGLRERARIVDFGCGIGRSSEPLITNGFPVTGVDENSTLLARAKAEHPSATWKEGSPERTGLQPESFDVVISGDALHRYDGARCIEEATRLLVPGGIFAAWWRNQMSEDPVSDECIAAAQESGFTWISSGLVRGFREFYAAPSLENQTLRVIPWRRTQRISDIVAEQIARPEISEACKGDTGSYEKRLKKRLTARFGDGNPYLSLAYLVYMYTGNRPKT